MIVNVDVDVVAVVDTVDVVAADDVDVTATTALLLDFCSVFNE